MKTCGKCSLNASLRLSGEIFLLPFLVLACSVPTSDFELFGGAHVEWESLSHRVSVLEAGLTAEGPEMAVVGGDWSTGESFSDWVHYRLASVEVRGARAGMAQKRVDVSIHPRGLNDDGELDREGVGRGTVEIPIVELGSWPVYTAVIQGFGIQTGVGQPGSFPAEYDAAHGYPLGRLAVEVGTVVKKEESVTVEASLWFEPASTEEAILDRPAMNDSIPHARFEGWIEVAVVGHEKAGTTLPLTATGDYPYNPPYSTQDPVVLEVDFEPGRLAAWKFLSFEANPGGNGDYIRSIGAEILGEEDLQAVGVELTNSSAFELAPFSYAIEGTLALIPGGRNTSVVLRSREGEAEVGAWVP